MIRRLREAREHLSDAITEARTIIELSANGGD
jgi:hypothetical protein